MMSTWIKLNGRPEHLQKNPLNGSKVLSRQILTEKVIEPFTNNLPYASCPYSVDWMPWPRDGSKDSKLYLT